MAALGKVNIAGEFQFIVTRDDVNKPKPDPEGLQLIYEHFKPINKRDILYIGDRAIDLIAGKQFGVLTVTPATLLISDIV
jgi:phosphoglycolate phosphatase/pyrophosphatase PpaX